jgi:uncharacterized membrane protein
VTLVFDRDVVFESGSKNVEHTWGMDVKTFLHDETNWQNEPFHAVQYTAENFITIAGPCGCHVMMMMMMVVMMMMIMMMMMMTMMMMMMIIHDHDCHYHRLHDETNWQNEQFYAGQYTAENFITMAGQCCNHHHHHHQHHNRLC